MAHVAADRKPGRPGRPKGGKNRRLDWELLKESFIVCEDSRAAFASRHNIDYGKLRARVEAEGWLELRQKFQRSAAKEASAKVHAEKVGTIVKSFRTSEQVRLDYHQLANDITQRVKRELMAQARHSSRQLYELTSVVNETYKLEMGTAGHEVDPQTINVNAKVLHAGVSAEQLMNLPDADLDTVLQSAAKAKLLPEKK